MDGWDDVLSVGHPTNDHGRGHVVKALRNVSRKAHNGSNRSPNVTYGGYGHPQPDPSSFRSLELQFGPNKSSDATKAVMHYVALQRYVSFRICIKFILYVKNRSGT